MEVIEVAVDNLSFDPSNARKHNLRNIEAIKASLAKFGQQKPIVISRENVVVAGNGTLEAAKQLGWQTVQAVRTSLTGTQLVSYGIADNRTGELAEWHTDVLGSLLQAISREDADLALATGYTDKEIAALISAADPELPRDEPAVNNAPEFLLVVQCEDEAQQRDLFEEFQGRGVKCKIM
jgi:ParB-like chromosome segregation protein Spo0J